MKGMKITKKEENEALFQAAATSTNEFTFFLFGILTILMLVADVAK